MRTSDLPAVDLAEPPVAHDAAVKAIIAKLHDAARARDFGLLAQASGDIRALSLASDVVRLRFSQSSVLVEALGAAYYALFPVMIGADQQFLLTTGMNGLGTLVLIWAGKSKRWAPNTPAAHAAHEFALALELQLLSWSVMDRIRLEQQALMASRDELFRTILEQATVPPGGTGLLN